MAQSRGGLVWGRLRAGVPMVYLAQERNSSGEKCTVVTEDRQRMVGCCSHSMVTAGHMQEMVKEWIHSNLKQRVGNKHNRIRLMSMVS